MDQLKKKNLGIPTRILIVMAYVIGYGVTKDYGILLVAVLFAVLVFALNFEDKVKASVKQSYIISLVSIIGYLGFDFIYQLSELFNPISIDYYTAHNFFSYLYKYGIGIYHLAVIAVFITLAVTALQDKKIEIHVISGLLDDEKSKAAKKKKKPSNQPNKPVLEDKEPQIPKSDQSNSQTPEIHNPQISQPNNLKEERKEPETVHRDSKAEERKESEIPHRDSKAEERKETETPHRDGQPEEMQKSEEVQNLEECHPDIGKEKLSGQKEEYITDMECEYDEKSKYSEETEEADNRLGPTCPKCGMMNRLEAVICSTCGTKLQ